MSDRAQAIDQLVHSWILEGRKPSAETRLDLADYEAGIIDYDTLVERVIGRTVGDDD